MLATWSGQKKNPQIITFQWKSADKFIHEMSTLLTIILDGRMNKQSENIMPPAPGSGDLKRKGGDPKRTQNRLIKRIILKDCYFRYWLQVALSVWFRCNSVGDTVQPFIIRILEVLEMLSVGKTNSCHHHHWAKGNTSKVDFKGHGCSFII